ncbi:MAG: baseplate J/gp47 family protein, partial [Anaerolineaceae bacterium]
EGVFGDGFASGSVMVNNLTGQEVSIPAGLLLQTGGEKPVQFRTTQAVTLAGQPADAQEVGIQAVLPGTASNVPAGSIRGVFGDLGLSIQVENPAPTSGGTDVNAPTLTQQDVDLARRALLAQIDSQAVQQANLNLKDGQLLIARSLRRTGAAGESLSVEIGMPCRVSVLTMQTEYSAWVMPYEDLARMSAIFLDTLLPEEMRAIDQTLQFNFTDPYREKTDGFVQQVEISRAIERAVDAPALVGGLLGRKASQISSILGVPDRGSVMDVSLSPVWWPVMPFFRFQYEIVEP